MKDSENKQDRLGVLILSSLGGASFFAGVFWSMRSIRKQEFFPVKNFQPLPTSPSRLAVRALLVGTALSFLITGTLLGGTWLLLGRPSLSSLGHELGSRIPKLKTPKTENDGCSDISSFRELFTYLQDEDAKKNKKE
ncbi:unnamed protein product [Hymenolepis diminuta]|uniref:Transmembrane protein 242 n=1 Tax=Hymenolepis diminuta TaxID=6216 RepID=A0A3P6WHD2_HYMDI|nr:unnamed protein product [Hymenolepis diminuta]